MDVIQSLTATAQEHRNKTGRPFVTLSYAQSLDGCIAARPGKALALSGRQSLTLTHRLRAAHDAILVGIGTVLSDNPRLNVRLVDGKNPRPIVIDTRLRTPLECNLLRQNPREPWIFTSEEPPSGPRRALETSGAVVFTHVTGHDGHVDLASMLDRLAAMGINSVMVEGGARIITNFLLERLADYMVLTVAPVMLRGFRGVLDVMYENDREPPDLLRISNRGHKWLGGDLILWGNLT